LSYSKSTARREQAQAAPVDDGYCRTCKWCDESEQEYGFCHAHPYSAKPTKDSIGCGVGKNERVLCFPVVIPMMDWCREWAWDGETPAEPNTQSVWDVSAVWICDECGREHGRPTTTGTSTWHYATCDWCGEIRPCTEPRDYGL